MSKDFSEDIVEQATKDVLKELGWEVVTAWKNESFGKNGALERESKKK